MNKVKKREVKLPWFVVSGFFMQNFVQKKITWLESQESTGDNINNNNYKSNLIVEEVRQLSLPTTTVVVAEKRMFVGFF